MTSGDLNFDLSEKSMKYFRNDFRRAFELTFWFLASMSRSRVTRGGGAVLNNPPIRWWKIQRPIRARVNVTLCS